jgi:hypothetical protein
MTTIGGSLTLALSRSTWQNNSVVIQGFGAMLPVTGAVSITSGTGADTIQLLNDWFRGTANIVTGTSLSATPNVLTIDGSRIDGAATIVMTGPSSELDLGSGTVFNGRLIVSSSPVYVTDYVNASGKPVHLVQTGNSNVIFVDSKGHWSQGTFSSPTQMSTPYFPGDTATASNNMSTITWTDGSIWTQTASTTAMTVTYYTNLNGIPVALIQNSSRTGQLGFVDGAGRTSLGSMLSLNTAQSNLYPNDVATISANNVTWQDGSVWTHGTAVPLVIGLSDANGTFSHVKMTSATALIGLDGPMQGLTATLSSGTLFWSNGTTWTNFDFNALGALFHMQTGYP